MRIITGMLILGFASDSMAMTQKEKIEICRSYYKKIEQLKDNKQHKTASKYKSKMYKLKCPTRHNRYFQ